MDPVAKDSVSAARPKRRTRGLTTQIIALILAHATPTTRRQFTFALTLVIAGASLAAVTPLALKWLVDAAAGSVQASPNATQSTGLLIACYVAALSGSRVLNELRALVAGSAEQHLNACLRRHFFAHLIALPLQFHLDRRAGAVAHNLYQATAACQAIVGVALTTILPVLVEVVTVAAIMWRLDQPTLLAIFAMTALAYVVTFGVAAQPWRQRASELSAATLDLHAVLNDNLVNIETIKSFGADTAALNRFSGATGVLQERWNALYSQRALLGLAISAILAVSIAAALAVSAQAVSEGTLTLGGFVMANVYMLQIVRPLELVGTALRELTQSAEFVRPMVDVLDQPTETVAEVSESSCTSPGSPDASTPAAQPLDIRFEQVCHAYGDGEPSLASVDLRVPAGRSLAIVGASGSGKSTLARLLLRLYEPQSGSITIGGTPIDEIPLHRLRAMIGVVSQDTVLFNDTIAFNISIGDTASQARIEAAARLAQLHEFILSTPDGYETQVGERGLKLSGGERQRLAIARAVLRRPSIYILDEATSMLDSETEAAVLSSLRAASSGCTTITIAHRLSTVQQADEIVVLAGGKVVERGRHANLLALGGSYARLWHLQRDASPPATKG